jgi:hypothetical protein
VCTLASDYSSPPALRSRSSRLRATSSSRASSFPCELFRAQCRDWGGVCFFFRAGHTKLVSHSNLGARFSYTSTNKYSPRQIYLLNANHFG